jgi:hypothetical protein
VLVEARETRDDVVAVRDRRGARAAVERRTLRDAPQPYDASGVSSPVPHALSAPPHAPRICVARRVRYALIFITVPDSAEQSVLAGSWPFKRMSWQRWTAFAVVCRNFADALLTVCAQVAAALTCGNGGQSGR